MERLRKKNIQILLKSFTFYIACFRNQRVFLDKLHVLIETISLLYCHQFRGGIHSFRNHSQVYHRIGGVLPTEDATPQFLRIDLIDGMMSF